ncbi:selenium cofactor biosynthesis protein YqeC [Halomicroarcula sp. GCM10025817]|uniref:selenium cofactor biosynthesis protein YqeC n=1 Tax=Haloarcula TaxID=2237 RepID=UPI0023E86057|nr:selenium cofactor biosynthesis protein YqeC [Halomicroarcula sp. SYNS111]
MDLTVALQAREGLVCVVGAGGKKSTLYTLAERLDRAVVTATVRIPIFDDRVATVRVTESPLEAIEAAGDDTWPLGLVPEQERPDRYRGYDPETVEAIAAADPVGTTLVKADGARTREFKAPGDREPQLPAAVDVVVPVASVQVVGEPLTDAAVHRPERVAALTGLSMGEEIRSEHVGRVLSSPDGGLKDVPDGATAIPLLNKVDDDEWGTVAREIAAVIHERADVPRVALTSMLADDPLVAVVD